MGSLVIIAHTLMMLFALSGRELELIVERNF